MIKFRNIDAEDLPEIQDGLHTFVFDTPVYNAMRESFDELWSRKIKGQYLAACPGAKEQDVESYRIFLFTQHLSDMTELMRKTPMAHN